MPKSDDWPDTCLDEALKSQPLVTVAADNRLRKLLRERLSERHLSAGELTKIANALIDDMSSDDAPNAEVGDED